MKDQVSSALKLNTSCSVRRTTDDALMRDRDAFWGSGGARGVDDVGGVVRVEAACRRGRGLLRDGGPVGIEQHDAWHVRGQPIEQRRTA